MTEETKAIIGGFIECRNQGYKKGYKNAIDKACEWLAERMWEMKAPDGEAYVVDGESSSISEFIRNFKNFMEEQQ